MSGTSREQKEEEHIRKRKEWVRITEELEDDRWKMSSEFALELLRYRQELSEDILSDLKEEEKILQADIRYWEADIGKMREEEDELLDKVCGMTSEDEENEYQEFLKVKEEKEEEEQNREEEEKSENSPQCATCSARGYLEHLRYIGENTEEDEKEFENSPQCATCLAQKEEERKEMEESSEEGYLEEEESSRYDSSE